MVGGKDMVKKILIVLGIVLVLFIVFVGFRHFSINNKEIAITDSLITRQQDLEKDYQAKGYSLDNPKRPYLRNLLYMDKVDSLLQNCDLFISVGTSGVVFPAAAFVQIAKQNGAETWEFNLENTSNNYYFDHHIFGPAGTTLPRFVNGLITEASPD